MWPVLARVYLRNVLNREPTAEEVGEQIQEKKTKLVDLVTSEAVNSAFENGQEVSVYRSVQPVMLFDLTFYIITASRHLGDEMRLIRL
jgi:hypothetical protein